MRQFAARLLEGRAKVNGALMRTLARGTLVAVWACLQS
jgi:hypothetical protein